MNQGKAQAKHSAEKLGNYDSRAPKANRKSVEARKARMIAHASPGVRALQHHLGMQGIVDIDPVTGTPRQVMRLDGYLTGRSAKPAAVIARSYVRQHPGVFKLNRHEVANLRLRKDYVDIGGTHHLSFVQSVRGVPVFGNGLRAHVDKHGRLIKVDGSPVAKLPTHLAAPTMSALAAQRTAVRAVFGKPSGSVKRTQAGAARTTTFSNGDQAKLVAFKTRSGMRSAWQVIDMGNGWLSVIDARDGSTLFRQSMVASDNGRAWKNFPDAPRGGTQHKVNLTAPGWLPNNSPRLAGNVAHVYKDINDNNAADAGEEVPPSGRRSFAYPFTPIDSDACPAGWTCSWDPNTPNSWQVNANQNAVQMFYFLGKFHDHLRKAPIGFTRTAGNFEAVDGDAVDGNAIDGANINGGLPDGQHIDNANMSTPPDGNSPRMQMYLFHEPGTAFPDEDPFLAGNSGDEADVVYHEYTHGLSNRLVVDANGNSTLGNVQAGSMGEAWSDWYAMDFLVNDGLFRDTNAAGDLRIGEYVGWGNDLIRTQPLDCPVGTTSAKCPGTPGAGPGGYTYGDFGKIIGAPEVHADGEIWAETLWDVRKALGSRLTESLVTRAMELSPANPSYLDERNAILQADLVNYGGRHQDKIWKLFAARGMGWFAASVDGDDTHPAEDFSTPPPANTPRGTLTGVVTDEATGAPAAGVVVGFGGHASGFGDDYAATTDANGEYTISGIIPGTYAKVFAKGGGFDQQVQTVSISSGSQSLDWALRRDWAALAGGATVVATNDDTGAPFGCGAAAMFDQSQGNGWSAEAVLTGPTSIEPRFVTVQLPVAIDISDLQINPSNTCGDAGSASTGDFSVETSQDGTTFTLAASGHFGIADRNMHSVPLSAGTTGVQYIRYTMIGTQVPDLGGTCPGNFSGCSFVDSVELAAYGSPS
ncbi:MAG TPA: M36 family metallopeptidase [Nocardioidaceae bacterium]